MKYFVLFSIIFFLKGNVFCQDLSGKWEGGLPQDDKSYIFTMETNMVQTGNSLSGTSKYKAGNTWVVEKFVGSINGKNIELKETEVLSYYGHLDWCVKIMNGELKIDKEQNKLVIEGTWVSYKLYNGTTYYNGYCSPGQFKISKSLPNTHSERIIINESSSINGVVYDKKTVEPLQANLIIIGNKSNKQIIPTSNNGTFNFKVPINDKCIIRVNADGYEPFQEEFDVDGLNLTKNFFLTPKIQSAKPNLELNSSFETKVEETVILQNVLFKVSTAILLEQSYPELNKLVEFMQKKVTMKIRLEGHTDKIGIPSDNMILSQDRVKEVKKYLVKKGINENRIDVKGYGDTKTICPPPCEANRRVEFVIIEK